MSGAGDVHARDNSSLRMPGWGPHVLGHMDWDWSIKERATGGHQGMGSGGSAAGQWVSGVGGEARDPVGSGSSSSLRDSPEMTRVTPSGVTPYNL